MFGGVKLEGRREGGEGGESRKGNWEGRRNGRVWSTYSRRENEREREGERENMFIAGDKLFEKKAPLKG